MYVKMHNFIRQIVFDEIWVSRFVSCDEVLNVLSCTADKVVFRRNVSQSKAFFLVKRTKPHLLTRFNKQERG